MQSSMIRATSKCRIDLRADWEQTGSRKSQPLRKSDENMPQGNAGAMMLNRFELRTPKSMEWLRCASTLQVSRHIAGRGECGVCSASSSVHQNGLCRPFDCPIEAPAANQGPASAGPAFHQSAAPSSRAELSSSMTWFTPCYQDILYRYEFSGELPARIADGDRK